MMIQTIPALTSAAARTMAAAAADHAARTGIGVTIVVVDGGGHLLLLERLSGATLASIEVAEKKAVCAVSYGMATDALAGGAQHSPAMTSLPHMLAFGGGIPIRIGTVIIGAIAVSGGTVAEDIACANAGLDALPVM